MGEMPRVTVRIPRSWSISNDVLPSAARPIRWPVQLKARLCVMPIVFFSVGGLQIHMRRQ